MENRAEEAQWLAEVNQEGFQVVTTGKDEQLQLANLVVNLLQS